MRIEKKFFLILLAIVIILLAVAAGLCVFVDRTNSQKNQAIHELEISEKTQETSQKLAKKLNELLESSNSLPLKDFSDFKPNSNKYGKIGDFSNLGFEFLYSEKTDFQNEFFSCLFFGCAGLGNEEKIHNREINNFISEILLFADSKISLKNSIVSFIISENRDISWKNVSNQFFESEHKYFLDEKNQKFGVSPWKNPKGFSKKIMRGGDAEFVGAFEKPQKVGDFHVHIFRDNFWLVREIHGNETTAWIQGFLLNKEKIIEILNAEIAGTDFRVKFPTREINANVIPAGFPLVILPKNFEINDFSSTKFSDFRVIIASIFSFFIVICSAIIFMASIISRSLSRERLFASAIAHELKSPLLKIENQIQKIEKECSGNEKALVETAKLNDDLKNFERIIDGVLLFSKITRGNADFAGTDLNFEQIFVPVAERIAAQLEVSGIDFDFYVPDEAKHLRVGISLEILERILQNLAENSAKYAFSKNNENPIFSIFVEVCGNELVLKIADNGNGFSALAKKQIFKEFSRSRKENFKKGRFGLGIGLALSRKLARYFDGDLKLEKSDSTGTTFLLTIKIKKS